MNADDKTAGAHKPIVADDGDGVVTEITPKSDAYYTEGAFGDDGEDDDGEEDAPFILDEDYERFPVLAELRDLVLKKQAAIG